MSIDQINGINLHYQTAGPADGPALVLSHALCTDLTVWDAVLPHLPTGLRIIRWDMRGHGRSACPPGPYAMDELITDAEALLDHLRVEACVFVGLSLGGFVAQGLAERRLDQIRAMVLSNTAAKLGQPAHWQAKIARLGTGGMATLADDMLRAWFAPASRKHMPLEHWHTSLLAQNAAGIGGCMAAISGTDLYTPTSGLRLPTLGIAGSDDTITPADLVRETVDLIPGSRLELMRRSGHLPCVEHPRDYARLLVDFLRETGHV